MPNHIINEIIFRGVDERQQDRIIAAACNGKGEIDFETLVPAPLNMWCGSVGLKHEQTFKRNHLDWAKENWGTKWNAYGQDEGGKYQSVARGNDILTLTFQTAWRPPYDWLAAMFNHLKLGFEYNCLDEGAERGISGKFEWSKMDGLMMEGWSEEPATNEMQRHLHKLLCGVEEFPAEPDEEVA